MSAEDHALRLRAYLVALSPEARGRLRDGLVGGAGRGDAIARAELQRLDEATDAADAFFRPLEPFLVDAAIAHHTPGCIARASLPALWAWVRHDLMPHDATAFQSAPTATGEVAAFQDRVVAALREVFSDDDAAARRQLLARIGTPHAADDAATLRWALRGRDGLAALAARLPACVADLAPSHVPPCIALIEEAARPRDVLTLALIVLMRRLAKPWQIVQLAAHRAGASTAARIEATPYGVAIDILLADIERQIAALSAALADGAGAAAVALIRAIDATIRGLSGEIAIPVGSTLGRRLQALGEEAAGMTRSAMAA